MKVLLSAYIGSHNLGDEAIAAVTANQLFQRGEVGLTVLSRRPKRTAELIGEKEIKVHPSGMLSFLSETKNCDCLVLGGGGIIQDESSLLNLLYYYLQVLWAKLLKKPVVWFFVGVGPIKTKAGKYLLKSLARKVDYSLVRDVESAALLEDSGFKPSEVQTAFDIVFNSAPPKPAPKQNNLLFCPRDWFFTSKAMTTKFALKRAKSNPSSRLYQFRRSLLAVVEQILLEDPNLTITGVPFFYTQDLDLLKWLKSHLPLASASRFQVMEGELTPREFLVLAARSKGVLGMRLHSLILGAVAQRPLVPLIYSAKVGSLSKYLGLEQSATKLSDPKVDTVDIAAKVKQMLDSEQTPYVAKLKGIVSSNQAAAHRAGLKMKELVDDRP